MANLCSKGGRLQFNFFEANEDKYKNLVGFKYPDEFIDLKQEHPAKEQVRKGGLPRGHKEHYRWSWSPAGVNHPSLLVLLAVRTPSRLSFTDHFVPDLSRSITKP